MTDLQPNEYQCDRCGNIYEKGLDDKEAIEESIKQFGKIDNPAIICDDCYKLLFLHVTMN